jgi:hypothetical protein
MIAISTLHSSPDPADPLPDLPDEEDIQTGPPKLPREQRIRLALRHYHEFNGTPKSRNYSPDRYPVPNQSHYIYKIESTERKSRAESRPETAIAIDSRRSRYCQMGNCTTRQMRNDHQEFCLRTSDVFVSVAKPLQMKPLLMCRFYLEPLQYFLSLLQCSEEDNTAASVRMNHRHFRLSLCMILSNYATHNDIAFSISIYFEVLDFNRSLHSSLLSLQNPLEMITDAGWEWANKSSLSS